MSSNSQAYRIQREANVFHVYEPGSEQRIEKYDDYKKASLRVVDLKRGEGFQGFTPTFFIPSIKRFIDSISYDDEEKTELENA